MMRLAIFLCLFSAVLAAQGGDIVGRVYEYCDKTPLTLVNAELKNGNTLVQKKGVNANGIFRFVGVAPGTYVIEVSRKNYMFYPTVQSVTVESASGQKDIGGIGLYSSACLANLKTQDLERIATQVTTFSAPNREALVANLKILRSAVRSDEKADSLAELLGTSHGVSGSVLIDAGFKFQFSPKVYASPAMHVLPKDG